MAHFTMCHSHTPRDGKTPHARWELGKAAPTDGRKPLFIMEYDEHDGCMCTQKTYDLLQNTKVPTICRIICDDDHFLSSPSKSKSKSINSCRCANPLRGGTFCAYDVCVDRRRSPDRIMCTAHGKIGECERLVNEAGRAKWPECPCLNGGNRTAFNNDECQCQCAENYFGEWCQDYRPSPNTGMDRTSTRGGSKDIVCFGNAYEAAIPAGTELSAITFAVPFGVIFAIIALCAVVGYQRRKEDRSGQRSNINEGPNEHQLRNLRPSPLTVEVLPSSPPIGALPLAYDPNRSPPPINVSSRSHRTRERLRAPPPPDIAREHAPMLPENHETPPPSYEEAMRNRPIVL